MLRFPPVAPTHSSRTPSGTKSKQNTKCFEHLFQFSSIDVILFLFLSFSTFFLPFPLPHVKPLHLKQNTAQKLSNGKSSAIYFYQTLDFLPFRQVVMFYAKYSWVWLSPWHNHCVRYGKPNERKLKITEWCRK